MDEAEAEAVLLALGPQLEWEHEHGIETKLTGTDRNTFYKVYGPEDSTYKVFCDEDGEWHYCNQGFKTIAAAKAACERHHATGKWE